MDLITAIAAGIVAAALLLGGATVTQQKPELCAAMGGTYQPTAPDQCPDGRWLNLLPKVAPHS